MAIRRKKFVENKFTHLPYSKDGYSLPDCKDLRAKKVLEFLIPIFYPKKSAMITIIVGKTIFEAYIGEQVVD